MVRWPLPRDHMTSQSRTVTATLCLGLCLMLGSSQFAYESTARGWGALAGYTIFALVFGSGLTSMPRRSGLAYAAYMMICAALFALPKLWTHRPTWWDGSIQVLFFGVAAWMVMQLWLDRTRPDTRR